MEKTKFTREEMVDGLVGFEKDFYQTSLESHGYGRKEAIQDMVEQGELFTEYPTYEEYHSKFRQLYSSMSDMELYNTHSSILDGLYDDED